MRQFSNQLIRWNIFVERLGLNLDNTFLNKNFRFFRWSFSYSKTHETMRFFLLILFSCLALSLVYCYPGGAPSCKQNVPSHDKFRATKGKSPYTIVANAPKALPNGEKVVTVTITGGRGKAFKGFHVIARTSTSSATIGKFTASENSKVIQCNSASVRRFNFE